MKRFLLPALGALSLLCAAYSQAFVVSKIHVEGLQRVSEATVLDSFPIRVGDDVQTKKLAQATRELFRAGYFQDVHLARENTTLLIQVVERPVIAAIEISGNKIIQTENLLKGLKEIGLAQGEIFQQATLAQVKLDLERQYVAQGRYGACVSAKVVKEPLNRVKILLKIVEGDTSKIKNISFVGNHVFASSTLLDNFQLKPSHITSWLSNDDQYSKEKLAADLENLRAFYLNQGYINFDIDSVQVLITPDKSHIYIAINLHEGKPFKVSNVTLSGDLVLPESTLKPLIYPHRGQTFSRLAVVETEKAIARRLGDKGYALARVQGEPSINNQDHRVSINFLVIPGKRIYVRRISFEGNTKTADSVLRREMRQLEGAWASTEKLEQSKLRLERLGYFKQVDMQTRPVPGTTDQIDVVFKVQEQPSGSITGTIGYSQGSGLILGGSVSQSNFLGSGNQVSLGINHSKYYTFYQFSYLNPYYTVDGISRGYSFYYSTTNYDKTDIASYSTDTWGGNINFGYPISETSRLSFALGVESIKIKEGDDPAIVIEKYLASKGHRAFNITTNVAWNWSELNRGFLPTRGFSQGASLEFALPGSDIKYYKLDYTGQRFFGLNKDLTLRLHTHLGYGAVVGGERLPFYENYYGGGFGSVRGFRDNTLGPRARALKNPRYDPIGGNVLVDGSATLLFPLPFIKDQRSFQTGLFFDVGNVFDTNCQNVPVSQVDSRNSITNCSKPDLKNLRYSVGVGVTWLTPLGPLNFSLAKPLNVKKGDDTQTFQFSLGGNF